MPNGFPEGKFRIINRDTGHCLASFYGGQSYGSQDAYDRLTGEKGAITYSHTNDRVFGLRSEPQNEDIELWYSDGSNDPWGKPKKRLFNIIEDIRTRWVLQVDEGQRYNLEGITEPAVGVRMFGAGRDGVNKWQEENGFIYVHGNWGQVLTLAYKAGSNEAVAVMTARGAPNQQWIFKEC